MKKTAIRAKNFVQRNERRILATVAVVSTTVAVIEQFGIQRLNGILADNDLLDLAYSTDED